jgi:hypothetical protein
LVAPRLLCNDEMRSLESMRSNSNHQKNGRTGEFSMGHTPKRAWESNDFLRLSGRIQYLSYTSSPLIFDLNIQQVEKKCVPAACGTSDDFIAQHETPYM